jgi:hypothetical protein
MQTSSKRVAARGARKISGDTGVGSVKGRGPNVKRPDATPKKKSPASIKMRPALDELLNSLVGQMRAMGPQDRRSIARPKGNRAVIPFRGLRKNRWVCMPPKGFLVPPRSHNLNDEMAQAVGEYIELETTRSIERGLDKITLKKTMRVRQTRKPHLDAIWNRKRLTN